MLKFLDNRYHEKEKKSPKKYQPGFLYGNSFQSPKQFQTKYTLFHNPSYVNPYLQYQKQRLVKIPSENLSCVGPQWKKKIDLQSIQEQKILSNNNDFDIVDLNASKYLSSFYNQFDHNQSRFKKTKGQFTTFIQKNLKFKSLGPIHGDERDQTRINQTKKSVWLKSSRSMFENQSRNFKKSIELNTSLKSSISKNSSLIVQKNRIRANRQRTHNNFRKSLQSRKYDHNNSLLFELPKKGPQHELTFYNTAKRQLFGTRYLANQIKILENQDINGDIQRFQRTTRNRLK